VYGVFVSNDYVTITVVDTNTLNQLPYQESFESYVSGARIGGINGWYLTNPDAAVVKATNYTYSGSYPIGGQHTLALLVDGNVSNKFQNTALITNIWIDMVMECRYWTDTEAPDPGADTQFAVHISSNGHLMVWNCRTNPPPVTNVWTELPSTSVASNEIVRLTIQGSYTRDASGYFKFRLWLNGVAVTTPSTWFTAASTNRNWLSDVAMQGLFHMDDLVVVANDVFGWRTILASMLGRGTMSTSGVVLVPLNGTTNFVMTPGVWYHMGSVVVDNLNIGTPTNYIFTNVIANHTIVANFAPDLAASNTPKWWLEQWYAPSNFDAAAAGDSDNDGMYTWEEYIAGTHPTNPASVFELSIMDIGRQAVVSYDTIPAGAEYDGKSRYYSLESRTNMLLNSWTGVAGWTNIPGLGQTIIFTNRSGDRMFYMRGKTELF